MSMRRRPRRSTKGREHCRPCTRRRSARGKTVTSSSGGLTEDEIVAKCWDTALGRRARGTHVAEAQVALRGGGAERESEDDFLEAGHDLDRTCRSRFSAVTPTRSSDLGRLRRRTSAREGSEQHARALGPPRRGRREFRFRARPTSGTLSQGRTGVFQGCAQVTAAPVSPDTGPG